MRTVIAGLVGLACLIAGSASAAGQVFCPPDRDAPGDEAIQAHLAVEAEKIHGRFLDGVASAEDWERLRPQYKREYFHMLGLWPLPEKTPMQATVTGTLEGDGYVVEKLHYQSRPRLYVTGNLYRPPTIKAGERLPAIFYVCGHSGRGRNGNKTAYQSHGMWFARHGYVCLVVDSLQLGEIAAIHHGTYREQRWWWHSRGYTSAGVECWNGVRGIDYLISRPDVDPERIAVTGISGGGAATFWIAAADERAKVAVPVSGMADLPSYIPNRMINGHCDCMFLYNTYRWPWTRIAALIAPRPMLFVNSDNDRIFPMDANERIINRIESLYSRFGAGDLVDSVVSIGNHAYRQDIRQAAFRFINTHLKNEPTGVLDTEVDLVTGSGKDLEHPIDPERLRVFPTDGDIPKDELNTTIDEHFVPIRHVEPPGAGKFEAWKKGLLDELRHVTFGYFPDRIPAARSSGPINGATEKLRSEAHIEIRVRGANPLREKAKRTVLIVLNAGEDEAMPSWFAPLCGSGDTVLVCSPRGVGQSRWTQRNPPNYVERSFALLGRTVDTGRVWDIASTVRCLRRRDPDMPVYVAGRGAAGVLGAYAALVERDIAGVIAVDPPAGHMSKGAPALLNVLRVCDIPEVLGMVAPRPLMLIGGKDKAGQRTAAVYAAAGAADRLNRRPK